MTDCDPTATMFTLVHDGVSQSAAVAWRWLRREGDVSVNDLAEAFDVSYPTAHSWLTTLEKRGVVETRRTVSDGRGRNPLLASAQARCPECGEWFDGANGVATHIGSAHTVNAGQLKKMSPDAVGEDPSPPPVRGERDE